MIPIVPIVWAIVQMFGMFFLGGLFRHLGYFREEELNRYSRFVIDCLFPFLVFHAVLTGLDPSRLHELWVLPFVGFGLMAFGAVLGFGLRYGVGRHDPDLRKTFHHFCAINNYGFLPIIIVQNVWGEAMLANLFLLNVGSNLGFWSIGIALLGSDSWRQTLKNVLSPSFIALCTAFVLALLGAGPWFPPVVLKVAAMAGSAAVPLILILIGATLYGNLHLRLWRELTYLTVVRLAIIPAITIVLVRLLPIPEDVYLLVLIVALMPVASSTTILTRRYGGSPQFAGQAAVVTTIVSMATIPLALWLLA